MSFVSIQKIFGTDNTIFFNYYVAFVVILDIQLACMIPIFIVYSSYDNANFSFQQDQNQYMIIDTVATGIFSSACWSFLLFANMIFFIYLRQMHDKVLHEETEKSQIQDYVTIVYNISKQQASQSVIQVLQEALHDTCIKSIYGQKIHRFYDKD
eukprot:EST44535.1 Transmembrane domain-containing protein [Spironucleus salmonicida]